MKFKPEKYILTNFRRSKIFTLFAVFLSLIISYPIKSNSKDLDIDKNLQSGFGPHPVSKGDYMICPDGRFLRRDIFGEPEDNKVWPSENFKRYGYWMQINSSWKIYTKLYRGICYIKKNAYN